MKTDDLFFGPKAKIARARQHITTLEDAEATYIDSQPVERFEEPAENGFTAYKIRATKQPPNYLPAIVADAIGGLQSSLDLAVCACGIAKGATDLKQTYFHFANTEAEWDKLVKRQDKIRSESDCEGYAHAEAVERRQQFSLRLEQARRRRQASTSDANGVQPQ